MYSPFVEAIFIGSLLVSLALVIIVKCLGGTVVRATGLTVNLIIWTIIAAQTVSQTAPPSAVALPPLIKTMFRALEALQLSGIVLSPSCTGTYAFSTEVTVMSISISITAAFTTFMSFMMPIRFRTKPTLQMIGRVSLTLVFVLFPATVRYVVSTLYCTQVMFRAFGGCASPIFNT